MATYCPLTKFCKDYPSCSNFSGGKWLRCTTYTQFFDFLCFAFETYLDNIEEEYDEEFSLDDDNDFRRDID